MRMKTPTELKFVILDAMQAKEGRCENQGKCDQYLHVVRPARLGEDMVNHDKRIQWGGGPFTYEEIEAIVRVFEWWDLAQTASTLKRITLSWAEMHELGASALSGFCEREKQKGSSTEDRIYPCEECGKLRTKSEGGTLYTVCDECWDKLFE